MHNSQVNGRKAHSACTLFNPQCYAFCNMVCNSHSRSYKVIDFGCTWQSLYATSY